MRCVRLAPSDKHRIVSTVVALHTTLDIPQHMHPPLPWSRPGWKWMGWVRLMPNTAMPNEKRWSLLGIE